MIANSHKQQTPPLRCGPVGMTNYVDDFRDRTLAEDGANLGDDLFDCD